MVEWGCSKHRADEEWELEGGITLMDASMLEIVRKCNEFVKQVMSLLSWIFRARLQLVVQR